MAEPNMGVPDDKHDSDEVLREGLRHWEQEQPGVPDFTAVRRRIASSPSPLEQAPWTLRRSARLAWALACKQMRIVPWLVLPVALVTATMAVLAARFFGVSHNASAAVSGFASLMLVGIAVTVTMALSSARADQVSLATPIGPPTVVLSRVMVVLVLDMAAGALASVVVASWGTGAGLAAVLAGWMVPLSVIAGAVTLISIWATPWAGVVIGLALTPLVSPPSDAVMTFGLGTAAAALHDAITPVGIIAVGLGLFGLALLTSRRALTASTSSA